jgi:branched-chain amino acid transport system permease protein
MSSLVDISSLASISSLATVLLDGVAYGMVLFIISVGLTATLGLMRVVNLAHGAFAMIGGYLASVLIERGLPWELATLCGTLGAGLAGGALELGVFRRIYAKGELSQMLLSFGLVFIITGLLTAVFGTEFKRIPLPHYLTGESDLGFRSYPTYRLFVVGVGAGLFALLWFFIDGSLYGARIRAAVDKPGMARGVGIDVGRLFSLTFALGAALAGFGGVVGAELLLLEPSYALKYLVTFLVVVVLGGHGSFKGSFIAAIGVGCAETLGKFYFPQLSAYVIFVLIVGLLLWRPHGLVRAAASSR